MNAVVGSIVVVVVAVVVVDKVVGADVVVIMVAVDDCVVAVGVSGWTLFSVLCNKEQETIRS